MPQTYVPHLRMSMLGRLGGVAGPEQFSMNINLDYSGEPRPEPFDWPFEPDDTQFTDLANDCAAWFSDPDTAIHPDAVLTRVKFASIGEDGLYTANPVERALNTPGGAAGNGRPHNQDAYVVTLHTDGDLGRVTGRFYVPMPTWGVSTDGRIVANAIDAAESNAVEFLQNVNNEPGIDVVGLRVVVASQGRHFPDGTQKLPPTNYRVERISVGRVVDTQRRRRNKLDEGRTVVPL